MSGADHVAESIHIAACDWTGNRVSCGKPAGDCQLRTRTTGFTRRRADSAVRELLGKRGTVQLNSNVEICGLGIRYNGKAFTSIGAIIPGVN